jgi:hypothetical protein
MVLRTTSSLNESQNDTGRTAFCGPTVVSAITGRPVSDIEAEIWRGREAPHDAERGRTVKGTDIAEVATALAHYGYRMDLVEDYKHLETKGRPSLWQWMHKRRNAWVYYVLGVSKGRQGHWIVVKGVMFCDTYTGGRWRFVCDGPHKGARILDVHQVSPALPG